MKTRPSFLLVLVAFVMSFAGQAQTFTTLKSFGVLSNKVGTVLRSPLVMGEDGALYGTASAGGGIVRGTIFRIGTNGADFALLKQFTNQLDGSFPKSGLLASGATLYGTTSAGGAEDGGTIFKMNTDGAGFIVLKNLPAGSYNRNLPLPLYGGGSSHEPNPPMGGLALSGTTLYGTTRSGGAAARGTVFKLETDGSGYAVLKEFSGPDGAAPTGDLVVSGSTLYGTTSYGGSANTGTVFKVNIDGSGFAVLKHFTGPNGAGPYAGLVLSGGTLYGVTVRGGAFSSQAGTIFKINTDGSGFTVLKSINSSAFPPQGTGPMGRLLISDNMLYGTAGSLLNFTPGVATVFRLNTDGTGFATIMAGTNSPTTRVFFTQAGLVLSGNKLYGTMTGPNLPPNEANLAGSFFDLVFSVNTDGTERTTLKRFDNISGGDASRPGTLALAGETLFGASPSGGSFNHGALFKINTDGGGYTILKHFDRTNSGSAPYARLTLSGHTIYGSAGGGGANDAGTLFKLDTNGGAFSVVKNFDAAVAGGPTGFTLSDSTIYGVAAGGGVNGHGSVYKVNTNGSGFALIKDFNNEPSYTQLYVEPLVVGNTLYSVTEDGIVFKVNTSGSGYAVLHTFVFGDPVYPPTGRLALVGNTLYGMGAAIVSSTNSAGAIYKVNTDGTGFGIVAHLTDRRLGSYSRSYGGLLISGSTIYGATLKAVFQVNTDGSNFAVIKAFGSAPDGNELHGDLILNGTTLYGSTSAGGEVGEGTIFRLDLTPRLTVAHASSNVRITWPSFAKEYVLEQTPDLNVMGWTQFGSIPENDGTNRIVTIPASTNLHLFRLSR